MIIPLYFPVIGKVSVHNLLGGTEDLTALSGRLDSVCERKKSVQSPLPEVSANKVYFSRFHS